MKRRLTIALFLAATASARGQDAPPIARYVPPAPDARHVFVMDSAHILSDAEVRALQDSTQALQTETGADVAWVTLPTLGGRAIEDATVYLGRTWKIGSAGNPGDELRNRGLLILYVPDKSKTAGSNFRVEVGTGLQGTIIDSRSRAISTAMRDDLRAKRYDAAYERGWAVAAAMVRADFATHDAKAPVPVPAAPAKREGNYGPLIVIVLIGVGLVIVVIVVARMASRPRRRIGRTPIDGPGAAWLATAAVLSDDDDSRRRRDDDGGSWFSSDSSDSGSSSDSGGDFGGGGGFDGGGSSDSI